MNINRLKALVTLLKDLASQSKCEKRGVSAIIADDSLSQIYSIGVNGGPKGQADCLCNGPTKYGCIHAEINALIKCPVSCEGKTMLISLSPCITCATAIINAGISKVFILDYWKDETALALLNKAGIGVFKISDIV